MHCINAFPRLPVLTLPTHLNVIEEEGEGLHLIWWRQFRPRASVRIGDFRRLPSLFTARLAIRSCLLTPWPLSLQWYLQTFSLFVFYHHKKIFLVLWTCGRVKRASINCTAFMKQKLRNFWGLMILPFFAAFAMFTVSSGFYLFLEVTVYDISLFLHFFRRISPFVVFPYWCLISSTFVSMILVREERI